MTAQRTESRINMLMRVYEEKCVYCKVHVIKYPHVKGEPFKQNKATIDHATPKARGGSNDPSNLVLSCIKCNTRKGQMTKKEYLAWMSLIDENSPQWIEDAPAPVPVLTEKKEEAPAKKTTQHHVVTDRGLVSWLRNKHGIDTDRLKDTVLKEGLIDSLNTQTNFIVGVDGCTYCVKGGKINYVSAPYQQPNVLDD